MKQSKYLLILIILNIIVLSGCALSPDKVKLATQGEMQMHVTQQYGPVEFMGKSDSENSITYRFKDKEFGFEYKVNSSASSVGMDGSVFYYTESKASNFYEIYKKYILEKLNEVLKSAKSNLNIQYDIKYYESPYFMTINCDSSNLQEVVDFISELGLQLSEIDSRTYFGESTIHLVCDSEHVGDYIIGVGVYRTKAEQEVDYYMERASVILDSKLKDLEYTCSEILDIEEIPGIGAKTVVDVLGENEDIVTCYYFRYSGKEYFITSVNIESARSYIEQFIYNVTDGVPVN